MMPERDWNVVVTVHEAGFKVARRVLREAGAVSPTEYHDVLVMKVADPHAFLDWLAEQVTREPGLLNFISRVVPVARAFDFSDAAEFESKARAAIFEITPQIAGKSFYVRIHRRGFRQHFSAREEERRLGALLLESSAAAGTPATVTFDDPDAIVAIETVGGRAGLAVFSREDIERCPFLRFD